MAVNDLLVSCLCVTRRRVPMLRRAVQCFLEQAYEARELVVVYESDDHATCEYLGAINNPKIRAVEVPVVPKLPLGALRNIAIEAANGVFVAQWDDDDWYAPNRLSAQLDALLKSGKPGCVLLRWIIYDAITNKSYLSVHRAWEGSLLAIRSKLPPFPDLPRGEDSCVIEQMVKNGELTGLDRPDLYIYSYHGGNTWDREHFEKNILQYSQSLISADQDRVHSLMML